MCLSRLGAIRLVGVRRVILILVGSRGRSRSRSRLVVHLRLRLLRLGLVRLLELLGLVRWLRRGI